MRDLQTSGAEARMKQLLLGIAAPKRTIGKASFERETLRRGGPYEVQGKRRRPASVHDTGSPPLNLSGVLKRMPR